MSTGYKWCILFSCLYLLSSTSVASELKSFKVYYIPLDADFYTPVTPKNIEERSFYVFEISSSKINLLFKSTNGNTEGFVNDNDYKGIRIKIISNDDGRVVYITSERRILSEGKRFNVDEVIINGALEDIIEFSKTMKSRKPLGKKKI